jgi:large subunit ribosomal protein L2
MRYMGGGHKQKYRIIDFKRDKEGIPGKLKPLNMIQTTARIALVNYADGEKRYIIAPHGLKLDRTSFR